MLQVLPMQRNKSTNYGVIFVYVKVHVKRAYGINFVFVKVHDKRPRDTQNLSRNLDARNQSQSTFYHQKWHSQQFF